MQTVDTGQLVGLEPGGATRLRGLLDHTATWLDECAGRVQSLLDEAGVRCTAPMEIRGAARTCQGTGVDLGGRIPLVEDGGGLGAGPVWIPFDPRQTRLGLSQVVRSVPEGCGPVPVMDVLLPCSRPRPSPGIFVRPDRPAGPFLTGTPAVSWVDRSAGRSRPEKGANTDGGESGGEHEGAQPGDGQGDDGLPPFKSPVAGTGKERASDAPSWVKNDPEGRPRVGENGRAFAERMMDEHYGEGNWQGRGARSEYSQIQKYGDRGFQ